MRATIAWWDLSESDQTIESLRARLEEEGVEQWAYVRGLRLKFWISDPEQNRWGAVMLWESEPTTPLPPNRAAELIGYPPTDRMTADVEAAVEPVRSAS